MVQVGNPESVVQVQLAAGESATVPTGEVWRVRIHGTRHSATWAHAEINSTPFMNIQHDTTDARGQGDSAVDTVLVGGDTIYCGNYTDTGLTITGREVSGVVDNTPVSVQLDSGNTPYSIPTGETWRVFPAAGRNTTSWMGADLNATRWLSAGPEKQVIACQTILTGGDSIDITTGGSGAGIHLGGFKL